MAKKTRTITIDDDIFNAIKTLSVAYNRSVSSIFEELARQFLKDNSDALQKFYQKQIKTLAQDSQS